MSLKNCDLLIENANIVSFSSDQVDQYDEITQAAMAITDGKISWIGAQQQACDFQAEQRIDASGQWLTPGLIDCHTHLVYGGNRAEEFEMRLQGVSYEEIARRGGGIANTVKATREASEETLYASAEKRLKALISQGVTSVEIKSGYGLDLVNERKMLQVAKQLDENYPVTVSKTFLGAHALPPEYQEQPDAYIDLIVEQMLPELHQQGLVDVVDAFCENIGFSAEQVDRVFAKAKQLGLKVKLHAEQLSDQGGAELVASYDGLSADHLEFLTDMGIKAMADAGTVAVLLPGAYYFLRETQLPPIQAMRDAGVKIALATDSNPGSSPITQLPLMLNMGCTLFRLTPAEALRGVTKHAAKALGMEKKVGSLQVGMQADIAIWDIQHPAELSYQVGVNPLTALFKNGVRLEQK